MATSKPVGMAYLFDDGCMTVEVDDIFDALWPLSCSFEYASEIGFALSQVHASWWNQWLAVDKVAHQWPFQVKGMMFLRWAESIVNEKELRLLLSQCLAFCPEKVGLALISAYQETQRKLVYNFEKEEPIFLAGQAVSLYAPVACAGYPLGTTSNLDQWTIQALAGSSCQYPASGLQPLSDLMEVHSPDLIKGIAYIASQGGGELTPDTWASEAALQVAQSCAGAVIQAIDDANNHLRIPLCLSRPIAHHAEKDRSGGGSLVNAFAVGAVWALRSGAKKVAIIDLDARHGNGTEHCFFDTEKVLTVSVHQQNLFSGTGNENQGLANKNYALAAGTDGKQWLDNVLQGVYETSRFGPDVVLVQFSANAHYADPTSDLLVADKDYFEAVKAIETLGVPVVYELGTASSKRAWIGAVRSLVTAAGTAPRRSQSWY